MKGGTQTQTTSQIKQPTDSHTKKPTAEQIRYAQLLGNEDVKVVQEQIRQVADVTGRSIDEVSVALHDCNYDTELTINSLLEGRFDQNEWVISSNRKKKHQGGSGTTQGIDNINTTGKQQKDAPRQTRGSRGGRNRSSDQKSWESDQKDNDENRPPENGRGRGLRDDRSSDRRMPSGRGGPSRRGRGGGNRGRSSSRGRGGRIGKGGPPVPQPSSNGPTVNGTEMWDNLDAEEELKNKPESWEDSTQPAETWDSDTYIHPPPASVKEPVAPTSMSSLFSSVSQSNNSWTTDSKDQPWGNGETVTTNGTAVTSTREQSSDNTTFTPESVDMAIIHSKLQSPSRSSDQSHTTNDLSSLMHITLPTSANQNHLGPISKLLDNVSMASLTQQTPSVSTAQPQRQPKASRSKRSQKSQIPLQAVEMPDSMMDDLDVQFGQLEFGGDFSGSPMKTKGMESSVTMPSEDDRPSKQQTVEPEVMSSLPSTLSSSLSRSVPVTIASTTSVASSLTGLDDHSPRHYPHASPHDHKSQVLDRPKTPPSIDNDSSSLSGVSRSPTIPPSSLQSTQLVSSLPKENTLDSRAYQVGQHIPSQPTLTNKDQLTSNSLGHHSTLGGTVMTNTQRTDSGSNHPLQPPPGVGVPHSTSQQASSAMGLSTATVSSSSRPAQHSGKPSLPPGVLPINTLYGIQQPGMVPGYSMPFSYEELQRQMHMPQAYYDLSFTGRDNLQPGTFQTDQKFGRSDASSPVQTTVNQPQNQHHMQQQQQQAYLNAAATMPPYGFGGLAFYPGGGMMPGGFPTYSAPMYQQMAPKTHVNVSQYQQQAFNSQHGSHNYSSGYDDLGGGHDFNKSPYHSAASQTQSKSSAVVSTSADIGGGSSYKSQIGKYDTKAFLGSTPPPLSLGQHSHLGNYPGHTPPFMSMVPPTQQHHLHSLFHHHAVAHQHQDIGQAGMSQRGQQSQLSKQSQSKGSYPSGFWSSGNKP